MKRITIDVADDFDVSADEIFELFAGAQLGVVYGVQVDEVPDEGTNPPTPQPLKGPTP